MNALFLSYQNGLRCVFSVFLVLSVSLAACQGPNSLAKQSEKAYQASNYPEAVDLAVKSLKAKPDLDRAIEALQVAHPAAERYFESRINQLKASSNQFRDENTVKQRKEIVTLYQQLIDMNNEVYSLPPLKGKKTGATYNPFRQE